MIRRLFNIIILIFVINLYGCREDASTNKVELKIQNCIVDTLDGLEFAYKVKIDNKSNKKINFYTGLTESESLAKDGFYLKFNKIGKAYQMTALVKNGNLTLPAQMNKSEFVIDICFREYCKYISDFNSIYDTYYTSKNKLENIKQILKDISIEYRVNKSFNDKNYNSAFKSDSVIYFNRLDTIEIKFYTEITGDIINQMLKR